jgi:hypothetical protein
MAVDIDQAHDRTARGNRRPILVTGIPRSGTTWLARLFATAPGTALAGREPMNPRRRQYALGHTLDRWTRLRDPSPRQRRELQLAFRGLNPMLYSRYGRRQWAAALPWTRLVMKDPFAVLSIPAVAAVTGARPVLVYRHPGAILASFRRMGWGIDLDELQISVAAYRADARADDPVIDDLPATDSVSEPEAMGLYWSAVHAMALADLDRSPGTIVVSHQEIAGGGVSAAHRLFGVLGLEWGPRTDAELAAEAAATRPVDSTELHNFNRSPQQVAEEWRARLSDADTETIEAVTAPIRQRLHESRLPLVDG